MANASYVVPHFLGGELSQFAQGRFDRPDYHFSLNVCQNAFPVEIGPWTRRPGTKHAGPTRGGLPGRVVKFDFEQTSPYTIEFTDGWMRFRSGTELATTNDAATVTAISSASPAVMTLSAAVSWATGDTVTFPIPAPAHALEKRQILITKIDTTNFSLADALSGLAIDGAALGTITAGCLVERVQEIVTPYLAGSWSDLRAVQAETTEILLNSGVRPQMLGVTSLPTATNDAVFNLKEISFTDGPYLDPFVNGVQANPNQTTGIVQITLSFATYSATKAYNKGDFVTSSSVNYISIIEQNVGNTPASSPASWQPASASAAINDGAGFLGSDVGRLVRFFSEPALWSSATAYSASNTVSYNPSGAPGAATYWECIANNTGIVPGTDTTHWRLMSATAAQWTWGKITGLLNFIPGAITGSVRIGTMAGAGGLDASFDGVLSKSSAASSLSSSGIITFNVYGQTDYRDYYVGQDYSATVATGYAVSSATVVPPTDLGLLTLYITAQFNAAPLILSLGGSIRLFGSNSAPSSPLNGTQLGVVSLPNAVLYSPATNFSYSAGWLPVTIPSNDTVTVWKYVWIVIEPFAVLASSSNTVSFVMSVHSAQVEIIAAGTPSSTSAGINVELLGPPLLYANSIRTWRLGAYSDTTGWPTCGAYHEGRLWLGGAISNRFDSSVSNGIHGTAIDFSPTDQNGVVAASAGISYTINSDSVNKLLWMEPDLQGIILGTQAGEFLIQAPTNGPLSPTNITTRRVTKIGCADIEPRKTDHTTVFVQRYGIKLMEYFSDVYSGKFSAPNIADKAQHIVKAGIAELMYQQAVTPIIWGRDTAGALFGITYKRDTLTTAQGPTYAAWHRHTLGSGRIVESICGGPSVGGDLDALTLVTNDPLTGVRHVEILTDTPDEGAPLSSSWFLDNGVAPTSTATTDTASAGAPYGGLTLYGLWHLNGKTVSVFAGGLDCGTFAVASGSCFVPYGDSVSAGTGAGLFTAAFVAAGINIVVGFSFVSQGQLVRPVSQADTGARNGPGFGKLRRNHRAVFQLCNTIGLQIGTTFSNLVPAPLRQPNGADLDALTMFNGIVDCAINDDSTFDGMLCWQSSGPFPATVTAAGGNIATQDQ